MGMYSMCPVCKAANRPCKALNCDAVLKALSHNMSCRRSERVALPALIYPPSLWSVVQRWSKQAAVQFAGWFISK